jgi:hypothetical protein
MSALSRRFTDREPPPGTPIAEFANGHDALEFVKVCKDKTYTVTSGVNMPFAVAKAFPEQASS